MENPPFTKESLHASNSLSALAVKSHWGASGMDSPRPTRFELVDIIGQRNSLPSSSLLSNNLGVF
jgi:hypothetical protein